MMLAFVSEVRFSWCISIRKTRKTSLFFFSFALSWHCKLNQVNW